MALEQAIKDALAKAKENPEDLKEIFATIGIDIKLPEPGQQPDVSKWFEELKNIITQKNDDKNDKNSLENNELKELKAQLQAISAALAEEKKAREESTKALQEKARKDREEAINKYIEEMLKDGRLEPKDEEKKKLYKELLEADFDKHKKIFDDLPKNPNLKNEAKKESQVVAPVTNTDPRETHKKMMEAAKAKIKEVISTN